MKNVDDLIESAAELSARGLSKGEIADELNVSRETASWLVGRTGRDATLEDDEGAGPHDIHVDWSALGRDSNRLNLTGRAMADLVSGGVGPDGDVDLVVGIEKAGTPLATTVARELDTDLATYAPRKHQWEEGDLENLGAAFSKNFADVRGRECYIVDDTVTSGTTMRETMEAVREQGGEPVGCVVLVDKRGLDEIDGVPVHSLLQVLRVGDGE
jgi:orotate phosphoribosyltransferase